LWFALADIAARIASPDVKGAFAAIAADAFGAAYTDALTVQRPALQKLYAAYVRDNNLDAILFPTAVAPAVAIDMGRDRGTCRSTAARRCRHSTR
jgi:mandelamide amidase